MDAQYLDTRNKSKICSKLKAVVSFKCLIEEHPLLLMTCLSFPCNSLHFSSFLFCSVVFFFCSLCSIAVEILFFHRKLVMRVVCVCDIAFIWTSVAAQFPAELHWNWTIIFYHPLDVPVISLLCGVFSLIFLPFYIIAIFAIENCLYGA